MPERALVLFEYPSINGGENSFLSVVDSLRAAAFELVAAAPMEGELADALREAGVGVEPLRTNGSQAAQSTRREELRRLFQRVRPQLVHSNSLAMSRLSGPVARDLGIPSIGHLRDMLKLSRAAIADLNLQTRLLAVSHATRRWYVALGLNSAKIDVVHNGVDLGRFHALAASGWLHEQLGISRSARLVGAVGQIGMRKGFDLLLTAFGTIAQAHPEMHLLIVGERHSQKPEALAFEAKLHQLADIPVARGRVHFMGRRLDVPRILPELAMLVHPARQEPLGRVLLEAAACGLAIVATRVGGTSEIFLDDVQAARLVMPDRHQDLAQAISEVYADRAAAQRLGQAARTRIEFAFDARQAGYHLATQYRRLLGVRS